MTLDFSKGLIPAIIVEDTTGDVLMLAYMNAQSYQKNARYRHDLVFLTFT